MKDTVRMRRLVNGLFEEQAMVLGGLVALRRVDDDLVWSVVHGLDGVRRRALRRVSAPRRGTSCRSERPLEPHPAIQDFLVRIRRE